MKILPRLAVVAAVAASGLWGAEQLRSNASLSALEQGAPSEQARTRSARRTPEQQRAWRDKRRRFAQLWIARHERDITRDMLVYLRDPDRYVRQNAACALGRLESARAEPVLRDLLRKMQKGKTEAQFEAMKGIPFLPLRLALGRMEARSLTGQAKLDRVVGSVNLKWRDVVALCQRVYAPRGRPGSAPPPLPLTAAQKMVVREVVDVLYTLRKQGQSTAAWEQQLMLPPAYKVMLKGAALPPNQEVRLILDYFARVKVLRLEEMDLETHLFGLKNSKSIIFTYLPKAKLNPGFTHPTGYSTLFYIAAAFGDRRAVPLIQRFEASSDRYIRLQARDIRKALEKDRAILPLIPVVP